MIFRKIKGNILLRVELNREKEKVRQLESSVESLKNRHKLELKKLEKAFDSKVESRETEDILRLKGTIKIKDDEIKRLSGIIEENKSKLEGVVDKSLGLEKIQRDSKSRFTLAHDFINQAMQQLRMVFEDVEKYNRKFSITNQKKKESLPDYHKEK